VSITYPLWLVVFFFYILLMARLVLSTIQVFARQWRPRGVMLLVAEAVFTVTDPPLRALRRLLPPLRIGNIQWDTAFMVLMILCWVLLQLFA
jgi:YggT family protein